MKGANRDAKQIHSAGAKCHMRPKLSVKESQQKYKDLYGNPDKRPEKIILRKNSQLKSLTLLPLWVTFFLCVFFPDSTRIKPLSVHRLSTVTVKYHTLRAVGYSYVSRERSHCEQPFDFSSSMCELRHTPRNVFDITSSYFAEITTQQAHLKATVT